MKATFAVSSVLLLVLFNRAHADTFGSGGNSFDIDFVTIGNPGNAADTTGTPNPAGSVPYIYNLGKYEVSRDMVTKANNLGSLAIPLFDLTSYGGNGANRPASGLSWNQAARFVNWLNTSTGNAPAYKFVIQPGEVGYDSNANIQLWASSDPGYNPNNLYRSSLARYVLPSADEWYKAAYYNPISGVYHEYPTNSNSAPIAVSGGTAAGTAVYKQPTSSGPADITLAGGLSPYGTMAQGGNVIEWEETDYDLVNGLLVTSAQRGLRGGYWSVTATTELASIIRGADSPTFGNGGIGLRVASIFVPEPSTLVLAVGILAPLAAYRRRESVRHYRV